MADADVRKNFQNHLDSLRNACFRASENNAIWRIYKIDRAKHCEIMNEYYGFFTCSIHAHFVATLMSVSSLYEKDEKTCNLEHLIKYAEKHTLIASKILKKQKSRLKRVEPIAAKFRNIRHNTFAHMNAKLSSEAIFKKWPCTPKEMTQLIRTAQLVLKDMFHHFGDDLGNLQQGAREDTLALLAVLAKAKKLKIEKPKRAGRPDFFTAIFKEAHRNKTSLVRKTTSYHAG